MQRPRVLARASAIGCVLWLTALISPSGDLLAQGVTAGAPAYVDGGAVQTDGAPSRTALSLPTGSDTVPADSAPPPASRGGAIPLLAEADLLVRSSLHALTAPARWGGREWALAGASVAAVALVSTVDAEGRELMAEVRSDRNTRIELLIEPFGAERALYLLGGTLLAGVVLDDEKLRYTAVEGLSAGLVAAGIVTPALQKVIGRAKPRAGLPVYTFDPFGGDRSLPSGHTAHAFAVASVIATEYDHPLVVVGAYGMATAVGISRMYRRSHYVSDVVAAAIIGTATGRAVARFGIRRRESLSLVPVVGAEGAGMLLTLRH